MATQQAERYEAECASDCPVEPLGGMVIVKILDGERITQGGIVLPHNVAEAIEKAVVVGVGTGKQLDSGVILAMSLRCGDTVIYRKHFGTYYDVGKLRYKMIAEADVLGRARD